MANKDPKVLFKYYVEERYNILQLRKQDADKPWSKDPIFQKTYFCNVFREDDKVTRFLRQQFQGRLIGHGNFMFWVVLSRLLNNIDSLIYLIEEGAAESGLYIPYVKKCLKKYRKEGGQLFNAAYIVSTAGKQMDKVDYIISLATRVDKMYRTSNLKNSCEDMYNVLTSVKGMGTFMAGQVIADLKNTKGHYLNIAPDWWTFVAQGPGSTKGLNYLNSRPAEQSINKNKFEIEIAAAANLLAELDIPKMCYQDVQNNLCEFSKYMRIYLGEGRSKRKYKGV